jgi:FlaA1/EpsC-like NDP-sugar epimerase
MGITKRLCEEVVRCAAELWPKTGFVTVRFGNVLGSRGSVVSIFRKQIKTGGPVTVTHPEMTRYFMTIPEAVRLVLEAGAVGSSGEVYLLEMGKPVKVLDLARDMIRLSGYEPGVDIKIEFTGIRPGEKIHERLTSSDERIESTPWSGLSLIRQPSHISPEEKPRALEQLRQVSDYGSASQMRRLLGELVPGCKCQLEAQTPTRESGETAAAKAS